VIQIYSKKVKVIFYCGLLLLLLFEILHGLIQLHYTIKDGIGKQYWLRVLFALLIIPFIIVGFFYLKNDRNKLLTVALLIIYIWFEISLVDEILHPIKILHKIMHSPPPPEFIIPPSHLSIAFPPLTASADDKCQHRVLDDDRSVINMLRIVSTPKEFQPVGNSPD
jgi:hypothetical protein